MAKGSFPYERRVAERLKRRANRQTQSLQEQRRNLASAKEEGIELTDEQFEAVSLGDCIMDFACPKGSGKID